MAKVKVQDATKEVASNAGRLLETVSKSRKQAQDALRALKALEELLTPRTSVLMLAHLSSECNCPELVRNLFETKLRELGRTDLRFEVLSQERPVGPVDLFDHMVAEEYGYAAN